MSAADESTSATPSARGRRRMRPAVAAANAGPCLSVRDIARSSRPTNCNREQPVSPRISSPPESFAESAAGITRSSRQGSEGLSQAQSQAQRTDSGTRSSGALRRYLRRWLCGLACLGAGDGAGRSKRRAEQRAEQLLTTTMPQAGPCGSPSSSLGRRSRRSRAPAIEERVEAASAGLVGAGANSSGGSSGSHVGPLPSRQLHFMQSSQDGGTGAPMDAGGGASAAQPPPMPGRSPATQSSASDPSSLNSGREIVSPGWGPCGLGVPVSVGGATFVTAGSRASSVASYASGATTTSRPSRWGLLAGILSTGLRSFSQLAGVVEPDTGNLSLAAVQDLTRRASCLDVVRAAGQVSDLTLVGSGSMGLVYRGQIVDPAAVAGGSGGGGTTVAIKYLVARGTDGMAAPATEGLLSRALVHPNIIATFSWHVTRITPDNFLDLPEALAAIAAREQRKAAASAAAAKHGRRGSGGKGRRTGGSGGSGALRLSSVPAALAAATAAAAAAACRRRPSSTTLLPAVVLSMSTAGGAGGNDGRCGGSSASGAASTGDCGRAGAREAQTGAPRAASATFPSHILDMVRASATHSAIPRARPLSPGGSPLTRLVLSRHQSFTAAPGTKRGPTASPLMRALATPGDPRNRKLLPPPPRPHSLTAPVPVPLPAVHQQQHQLQRASQPSKEKPDTQAHGQSPRVEYETSWSVTRTEFFRISDMPSSHIMQQPAAGDGAAPAAATAGGAAALAVAAPGALTRNSGTIASFFSRDSGGSNWYGPSPNASNHAPVLSGGRTTAFGPASSGAGGDGNLVMGTPLSVQQGCQPGGGGAQAPPPPPLQAPNLSVTAVPPVGCSAGRGRSTLVRAGSRLQFTTMNTHPSIPEDVHTMDDVSLYGDLPSSLAGPSDPREPGARLLSSIVGGDGGVGVGVDRGNASRDGGADRLPTIGSGARGPLCVALTAEATAAAAAASPRAGADPPSGSSHGTGGRSDGSGDATAGRIKSGVGSAVRGACCLLPGDPRTLLPPLQGEPGSGQPERNGGSSSGCSRIGLLAAALKSQLPSQSQSNGQSHHSRSQNLTSWSGLASGSNGRPAATPQLPLLLPHPTQPAARPMAHEVRPTLSIGGAGICLVQSRTGSTVLTRSTTASSAKRLSSAVIFTSAGPGLGAATNTGASIAIDLTPSGNGSGPAVVGSSSATGAGVGTGSGSVDAGPPAAQAVVANEGDVVRQEVVERGWRTLQHILQRLNARPGDYLTRIVMEDADQGSLLVALRSGRFATEGEGLRSLLLTALDIASGMAFLHRHNVIHGDLKPSNVLLCSDPSDPRGFIAKVRYLAPEVVRGSSFKASDVWSYAVVLWQMVSGEPAPWPGLRSMQIIMGVMQDELQLRVPPAVYPPLASLVHSCLAHDHKARPSFEDVVESLQAMVQDVARVNWRPQLLHRPADDILADKAATAAGGGGGGMSRRDARSGGVALTLGSGTSAFQSVALDTMPALVTSSVLVSAFASAAATAPSEAGSGGGGGSGTELDPDLDPHLDLAEGHEGYDDAPGPGLSPVPGSVIRGANPGSMHAASAARSNIRERTPEVYADESAAAAAAAGGSSGSFATAQCSLATSVSLTAAASSSNMLIKMSGSWAHTGTTTRTNTTMLLADREARGSNSSSAAMCAIAALHSSAFQLAHAASGGGGSGGGGGGHAGVQASSGSYLRGGRGLRISAGGSSGPTSAAERQCLQEMHVRPRTFLGAMLSDDLTAGGAIRRAAGGVSSQLTASLTAAAATGGVGDSQQGSTGRLKASLVGDFNQQVLEPVHEEQPPTSSSGGQTVMTHGSVPSGAMARLIAAGAAGGGDGPAGVGLSSGGALGGGGGGGGTEGDRGIASSAAASGSYCDGAATLPSMLQAGLIVLGVRELAAGQSAQSSGSVPQTSRASSDRFEEDLPSQQQAPWNQQHYNYQQLEQEQQQQQQQQAVDDTRRRRRRSVLSLESLPSVAATSYSRLSGRRG